MAKLQQARSEETRSRILNTALDLFGQAGYEPTGVAEICERCGISKGAFYHHFASKQALFIVLLEDWLSSVEKELTAAAAEAKSIPEALRMMACRFKDVLSLADGRVSIFLEFWTQARRDPEIWQRTIRPFRQYRRVFEAMIDQGIHEGSFKEVNPGIAALAMVSMAVGMLLQGVVDPQEQDWGSATVEAVDLFTQGMLRRNT